MKTKIIHIALGKGNPNRQNGVNKVVNNIATTQANNNINVELWGISFSQEHNYPKRNYITRLFLDHKTKFKIDLELYKAIDSVKNSDVIFHIHGGFIPQFYVLAKYLKSKNLNYVYTPHGAFNLKALEKSKWFKRAYILLFEKFLVNNAKAIQLLGESEKNGTVHYFKDANIYTIPNGENLKSEFYHEPNNPILKLGYLGRIDIHTKGLDRLIKALKNLNNPEIQLNIIGKGGDIDELKDLVIKNNLNSSVIFEGAKFDDEKLKSLQNLDALCLTSRNEGLPGVVLEAASIGVPCLISKETNLANYVNKHQSGWVLNKNTTKDIEEKIEEIINQKKKDKLKSYKKNALKMIEADFEWNNIIQQLNKIYNT